VNEFLTQIINEISERIGYGNDLRIIVSNRPELCDYQCDDAFRLAKEYKKSPMVIGNDIVEEINKREDFKEIFNEVTFVNPGFINMSVSNKLINKFIRKMNDEEKFGIKQEKAKTFVIDYGGPNVAKPLHVGHVRTAIVGESIKRIIKYVGHNTIGDVHLGDYGLQIGQVIYGLEKEGIAKENITIQSLEEIYPKMSALCKDDEDVKEKCASITKKLQDGDTEYRGIFEVILETSKKDIKRLYDYLNVSFDYWYGESDAYNYVETVEKLLSPYIKMSEGAEIIDVFDENGKELAPLIFKKSNGAYLYGTTDLATIYQRMEDFNPDNILYVVDNRQSLHFKQVFSVAKSSDLSKDTKLEFLGYGTVNGTDGKPFKTRSGDTPKLDDLFKQIKEIFINKREENKNLDEDDLDILVNSILKFADLQNTRDKDYIFDISKFGDVAGKTGPYILYTYLRNEKIMKNEVIKNELSDTIYSESDKNLRLKLLDLESAIRNAFEERKPHYIADYIYNLAVLSNTFYQYNHINGLEDIIKKDSLIYIMNLTNRVIKELLELIMIDIPKTM
jgi:arginyl-tRNA synthetase